MFSFTVEQIMIQEMVRKLTKEKILPRVPEIDENDEYPEDIVRILAENALLKLALPENYGGIDSDTTTLSLVIPNSLKLPRQWGLWCSLPNQ